MNVREKLLVYIDEIKLSDDNRVLTELDNKIKRLENLEIKKDEKEIIDKIMKSTDFTSNIEMNKSVVEIKENITADIKK